jgi:hypothetical protein
MRQLKSLEELFIEDGSRLRVSPSGLRFLGAGHDDDIEILHGTMMDCLGSNNHRGYAFPKWAMKDAEVKKLLAHEVFYKDTRKTVIEYYKCEVLSFDGSVRRVPEYDLEFK